MFDDLWLGDGRRAIIKCALTERKSNQKQGPVLRLRNRCSLVSICVIETNQIDFEKVFQIWSPFLNSYMPTFRYVFSSHK